MTHRALGFFLAGLLALNGCGSPPPPPPAAQTEGLELVRQFLATDALLAPYQLGRPYSVQGVSYSPAENLAYAQTGVASYYSSTLNGALTASGETYSSGLMTAAHKTLPFQTIVRVTDVRTGRAVVVRINDRGPFIDNRIIDLSERAALDLNMISTGTARVRVEVLPEETRVFAAALRNGRKLPGVAGPSQSSGAASAPAGNPVAATTPVGGFYIQVGTYTDAANANAIRDRMAILSTTAAVEQTSGVYRVIIGPLTSRLDAQAMLGRVFGQGATNASIVQR